MSIACIIMGAGDCTALHEKPAQGDLVIAADAGYLHLQRLGICPDWAVGDFDSLQTPPEGVKLRKLEPVKDDTDMYAAVRLGLEQGCRIFHLYGGMGGRLSHTLANIQLVARLSQQGMTAYLYGKTETLTAVTNASVSFSDKERGYLSVFAHSQSCSGVTENGLAYALQDAVLENTFPLGVSNEFIGQESTVSVKEGTLLLLWGEER